MTVCSFFLQGRCRYGDKCWNEHPRGGGGGGGRGAGSGDYGRGTPPSNRGGFGNRVWVNPQRAGGGDFVKPSSFGGRDAPVSTQNRFGALNTPSSFARGGQKDENEKHLETIQKDMEIWEASGQWLFSCYSVLKDTISGFVELSQEELRLEYYTGRASGDLQTYGNSVQQLVAQWRNRLQELKAMSGNTRSAMIAELNNPGQQSSFGSSAPSGFGSSSSFSGFGATAAPSGFGAAATPASGFGSSAAPSSGFGSGGFGAPAQPSAASFSFSSSQSAAPASSGFGSAQQSSFGSAAPSAAQSAAAFSFASPVDAASTPAATQASSSGFGSASGFSFASTAAPAPSSSSAGGFGGGFGSSGGGGGAGGFGATGGFGKPTNSGLFSSAGAAAAATPTDVASAGSLFTPQSELTSDELKEFMAKRFTLGQIPLKPPPADLLVI
ncbi:nucleoporin NUP42 [Engraulis encrasicolus]|uniref:nucleoporin NUP42 n=1 Tax=Engraulis encrasicolus TaxID=184585 RepID=UPI002FCFA668